MNTNEIVIESRPGWRSLDLKELFAYRDLFWFMLWRGVKVRYAQSTVGVGWAVIQPMFTMVVFTVIFGRMARIGSDGIPYALFSYTALVPWTFFSNALSQATDTMVTSANIITKVYFPRMILPLSAVGSKLVDFAVAFVILIGMMVWYHVPLSRDIFVLPLVLVIMIVSAAGAGLWVATMSVHYRDIKYAMSFLVQIFMYAAPVVYPASKIPARYQLIYALNPMVGVIEGFRAALLHSVKGMPIPWAFIGIGAVTSFLLLASGAAYFRREERLFADVA